MKIKLLITALMASLLTLTNGCFLVVLGAAAGAGAAGYAYANGEMESTENTTLDQTWTATLAAVKDLGYTTTEQSKDVLEGDLTVHDASNNTIKIKVKYVTKTSTEVHIRVGTFGDETISRQILNKINSHLGPVAGTQ